MRRVGYDAQAFLSANGGTGKGAQLRTLLGPYANQFTGFATEGKNYSELAVVQAGRRYQLWQVATLPLLLRRHAIDTFLAPYNVAPPRLPPNVKLLLVLHDLILLKQYRKTDLRSRLHDGYRRLRVAPSVRRAEIVLTVSEHTRGEILEQYPGTDVRVIPCTVSPAWFAPRALADRAGHLLMVTSAAPHKNSEGALEAYTRYVQMSGSSARPLEVVGLASHAEEYRARLLPEIRPLVHFRPYVAEDELRGLYQEAAALLFPSFVEGFGIPLLEAMSTGTPVIAARAASIPEVAAGAAYYFDPQNVDEMAHAIATVLGDGEQRERMAAEGLRRAEDFRPEKVGTRVVSFWQEVAGVTEATYSCPVHVT